jgi:hypothetical protein
MRVIEPATLLHEGLAIETALTCSAARLSSDKQLHCHAYGMTSGQSSDRSGPCSLSNPYPNQPSTTGLTLPK